MKQFNVQAHINSLNGEIREITIIRQNDLFGHKIPNSFICKYNNICCTAIYNWFTNEYYADDIYGIIKEEYL